MWDQSGIEYYDAVLNARQAKEINGQRDPGLIAGRSEHVRPERRECRALAGGVSEGRCDVREGGRSGQHATGARPICWSSLPSLQRGVGATVGFRSDSEAAEVGSAVDDRRDGASGETGGEVSEGEAGVVDEGETVG